MADEQLRMRAVVVDQSTGPLRNIARQLNLMNEQRADKLRAQFDNVGKSLKNVSREVVSTSQAMSGMTLIGVGVGAAITAAITKLRDFSKNTVVMKELSDLTNFSIKDINNFQRVMKRLDIEPQQAQAGLREFSKHLFEMKYRASEVRNFLAQHGAGGLAEQLTQLGKAGKSGEALKVTIDALERLAKSDPHKAEMLAQALFGNADFFKLYRFNEELRKVGPAIDRDWEASKRFWDQWNDIEDTVSDVGVKLANALLPSVVLLVKELQKLNLNSLVDDATRFLTDIRKTLEAINAIKSGDFSKIPKDLVVPGSPQEMLRKGRELLGTLPPGLADRAAQQQALLDKKRSDLTEIEKKITAVDRGSVAEQRLLEQREKLVREIDNINESIRKFKEELEGAAKKMSYMGSGIGGGGNVINAAYTPGGGGGGSPLRGFRSGGGFSLLDEGGQGTPGGGRAPGLGGFPMPGGSSPMPPSMRRSLGLPEGGGGGFASPSGSGALGGAGGLSTNRFSTGADGGTGRVARGRLAANQQEAYQAAIGAGLSDSAARVLVGNMSGESLKNPRDHHWDVKHMSQGIVQWDPARAERINRQFGKYPKDMSVSEQTQAAIWEMKTHYPRQYRDLQNENLSPEARMRSVVSGYERPANPGAATTQRMGFYRGFQPKGSPINNVATKREDNPSYPIGMTDSKPMSQQAGMQTGMPDRSMVFDKALSNELTSRVEGTGKITVDVNGHPGTKVSAEAGGLFKDVEINRSIQMTDAPTGPNENLGSGAP